MFSNSADIYSLLFIICNNYFQQESADETLFAESNKLSANRPPVQAPVTSFVTGA